MQISTLVAVLGGVLLAGQAAAQTELPSAPQPGRLPTSSPAWAPPAATLASEPAPASRYTRSTLGLDLGWGAPYGWGLSYAYLLSPQVDVTAGLGIGLGAKIGAGVRYYLTPLRALSPYFGLNLARTGRLDDVTLTLDEGLPSEETIRYAQPPAGVLHLRSGLRWQPRRVGLLGTLGYGVRLSGDPARYASSQNPSARMQQLMRIISPGGLELSLGLAISLSPR